MKVIQLPTLQHSRELSRDLKNVGSCQDGQLRKHPRTGQDKRSERLVGLIKVAGDIEVSSQKYMYVFWRKYLLLAEVSEVIESRVCGDNTR